MALRKTREGKKYKKITYKGIRKTIWVMFLTQGMNWNEK